MSPIRRVRPPIHRRVDHDALAEVWRISCSPARSVDSLSDAAESSVNLIAAMIAFAALTIAARPADDVHTYGHDKAEYFSAGAEGEVYPGRGDHDHLHGDRAFSPSGRAVLSRFGPGGRARGFCDQLRVSCFMLGQAKRYDSITLEADVHHLMTDVWTSVGVVAALAVVMVAPPSWAILDPIIAIRRGEHYPHRHRPDPTLGGGADGHCLAGRRSGANPGGDPRDRGPEAGYHGPSARGNPGHRGASSRVRTCRRPAR